MIKTDRRGEHVATCDECGGEEAGGTREFREFVSDLKDMGWKIRKDEDGNWTHECPDCVCY